MKFSISKELLAPGIKAASLLWNSEFTVIKYDAKTCILQIQPTGSVSHNLFTIKLVDTNLTKSFGKRIDTKKFFKLAQASTGDKVNLEITDAYVKILFNDTKISIAATNVDEIYDPAENDLGEIEANKVTESFDDHTAICSALGTSIFFKDKIVSIDSKSKHTIVMSKAPFTIPNKIKIGDKEYATKCALAGSSMSAIQSLLEKPHDDSKFTLGYFGGNQGVTSIYIKEVNPAYISRTCFSIYAEATYNSISQAAELAEKYKPKGSMTLNTAGLVDAIKLAGIADNTRVPEMVIKNDTMGKMEVATGTETFTTKMDSTNNVTCKLHINGGDLEKILKRSTKHSVDFTEINIGPQLPMMVIKIKKCIYFVACIGLPNSDTYKVGINEEAEVVRNA